MPIGGASTVALEQLDSHLKAILKLNLRAFVHLNPCFDNTHSIDMSSSQTNSVSSPVVSMQPEGRPGQPQAAPLPMFPPIPENEPVKADSELSEIERYRTIFEREHNTAASMAPDAQAVDCPNRLAVTRLRRRARV